MHYSNLQEAIECIIKGTKLQVGVFFFQGSKSKKCTLPIKHTLHTCAACYQFKNSVSEKCFRCRSYTFRKVIKTKKIYI